METRKKLVYLICPYTGTTEQISYRLRISRSYCTKLLLAGVHPISPIIHGHDICLHHTLPTDFNFWKDYCLNLLSACDEAHILELPGINESKGCQAEIEYCKQYNIPVKHVSLMSLLILTEPHGNK